MYSKIGYYFQNNLIYKVTFYFIYQLTYSLYPTALDVHILLFSILEANIFTIISNLNHPVIIPLNDLQNW